MKNEDRSQPAISNYIKDRNTPNSYNQGGTNECQELIDNVTIWRPGVSDQNITINKKQQ